MQRRLRKGRAGGLITVKTSMEYRRHRSHALIPLADKQSHQLVRACHYSLHNLTLSKWQNLPKLNFHFHCSCHVSFHAMILLINARLQWTVLAWSHSQPGPPVAHTIFASHTGPNWNHWSPGFTSFILSFRSWQSVLQLSFLISSHWINKLFLAKKKRMMTPSYPGYKRWLKID